MSALRTRLLPPGLARRACSVAVASSLLAASGGARAEPTASQIAAARELGRAGVMAAEAGDCATAVDKLARAEALYPAPTTAEPLGECQVKLGKIVAGTETLNRLVRQQLPPTASPVWVAAQNKARTVLATALPRIGKLRIHVERPAGAGAPTVTVDDEALDPALLDNDRPSDPGTHAVRVTASGCLPKETSVTLPEGTTQTLVVTLEPDPGAIHGAPPPSASAATPPATSATPGPGPVTPDAAAPSPPRDKTLAYVALGTGVVGVAVGTVFGVLALGAKNHLDGACTNKLCLPSSQSDIDTMHSDALVSTVGFGVGIVGVAVGGYMLLQGSSSPRPAKTGQVTVAPWVGPASLGLTGRF